jgi:hypothetical protein
MPTRSVAAGGGQKATPGTENTGAVRFFPVEFNPEP